MQENHGYNPKSRSTLLEKLKNDGKKMRSSVLYFIILFARWRDYLLQRYSFHAKKINAISITKPNAVVLVPRVRK